MPWHLGTSTDCPASKPIAVIKDSDGSIAGCHPTKAAAQKQLAALYASEASMTIEADERAGWTTAYINDLPDSAFACIDAGGSKEDGKTTPRSLRHYPHHDASGAVDDAHLANARARVKQQGTTSCGYFHLFHTHHLPSDQENSMPDQKASRPPRDNLVRAVFPGAELRDDDGGGIGTLTGEFAVFNQWTKIDSAYEGTFMERLAPGSFARTFTNNRDQIKVTFNHGQDPQLGDKVLGPIRTLEETKTGAHYEVPLLDTSYNRDLVPGLKAGVYGASFRFRVLKEDLVQKPNKSADNPDGLPERTIREAQVMEFGPVTYPAYAGASAGMRSLTDSYVRSLVGDALPAGPEAEPHSDDGTRSDPPPVEPAVVNPKDPPEGGSPDSRSAEVEYLTREDKASRVTELETSIKTRATAYPGVLPDEEQARDDAENAEHDALLRDIAAWDARVARVESFGQKDGNTERVGQPYRPATVNQINRVAERDIYDFEGVQTRANTPEGRLQLYRDNAMRITEIATFPHPDTDIEKSRDRMAWLLDHHDSPDKELAQRFMVTASPIYRRAFNKLVLHQPLSPEEQRGTALAVGVDATGGFAIPVIFDLSVIAIGSHTGAINPYRRVCRVVPIVGTDTWNALTATAVTATRTTEAAPAIEQGPTFAQPQYIVKRVQAQITYSLEVAQDRTDIASEMAVLIQEAKDNEEENQFAVGVGTTVFPLGVGPVNGTSGAYTSLTTSTSTTLLAADVDLVEAALPVRHRFNAQWFLNRSSIRSLQKLEILGGKVFGGNGYYPAVGNPGLDNTGNTGLRIIGYPVNESPSLPTATTANIVIGTLLNPDSYVIVDRIGMSVQIIPFIFGASQGNLVTGQQALYAMWRNDARPINVDAGRTLRYLT